MHIPKELSILNPKDSALLSEIYVSGTEEAIKEAINYIGGPIKTSKAAGVKYTRLKEWSSGRRPIPISFLKYLTESSENPGRTESRINSNDIYLSCRYSPHKVKFPRQVTKELAYIVGVILGDGSLSGKNSNERGNWKIAVCFDNEKHCKIYRRYMKRVFGINPKYYWTKKGYFECSIASKALHWFFQQFFEIKNGVKHDSIIVPSVVKAQSAGIVSWFIQGLFDTDGTIVPSRKTITFASTSEKIVQQLELLLKEFGITSYSNKWIKKGGFKALYSVRLHSRKSVLAFAENIGFQHPEKRKRLKKLCNSIT
jgi:intein/homing endonuclease